MKKILLLSLPFFMVACSSDDEKKPVEIPQVALTQSSNDASFSNKYELLLSNYYALQQSFVKEDTTAIANGAKTLMQITDSLPLNTLKADTVIIETAKADAQNLSDELKGLLGEKDIENKRKSFEVVSNHLLELTRIVQYDKAIIYVIHCPMAFKNKGADWLSKTTAIENPYLPKQMPECGEIKDSIDYRKK